MKVAVNAGQDMDSAGSQQESGRHYNLVIVDSSRGLDGKNVKQTSLNKDASAVLTATAMISCLCREGVFPGVNPVN